MKKIILHCFLLLYIMIVVFLGCATATNSSVKNSPNPQEATAITGIDIQDNVVTITANKPFVYNIHKTGDPYKILVDLPEVTIGAFTEKIVSNKTGITEIVPSQLNSPLMARLEILLQTPSIIEQKYKNNVLIVSMKDTPPKEVPRESKAASDRKEDKPEQKPLPKATEITSISFEKSADIVKVLIKGNGSMIPDVSPLDNRIVIDIPDVVLNTPLPSAVVSPVQGIRSAKQDNKIRLVLDLTENTKFDVASIRDSIVIALQGPEEELGILTEAQMPDEKTDTAVQEPKILPKDRCKTYLEGKENISFDFQDQDILPIFRLFADISGCNLFLHPDIKGRCTMKFIDVPWNQALDTILKTFSLGKAIEGNIIRIAPHTVFARESEEAAKAQEAGMKAEPLATKIFPVSYADVSIIEASVKSSKILTPRGSISVDKRTSTMLVRDIESVFPQVESLLATLDRPTPQVMVEARIVEVNTSDVTDLGIQWGAFLKGTNALTSLGGFSGLGTGSFTGENYLVDFPGGAGAGSGAGFTFGILNPSRTMGLDLQLSALETAGKGKIVSNPRIMTVDNGKATISQGDSIPIRKIDTQSGQISTDFKDYTLSMTVTPHITPDNSISMVIETTKEEPDWTRVSSEGTPASKKRAANTNVIIKDGETVVIGGVFKTSHQDSESGIPGLMNIPVLGWLFKNKKIMDESSELLIFITPRIVEKP
jgi:type IV pilus assembly protein PilQ